MLIVDAGPLFAAATSNDKHHERAVELLSAATRPLIVPALVVTEVAYLVGDRVGARAELAFARSLAAGELIVEPVLDSDWDRICEFVEDYADLPLGIVDASVVALAERLGAEQIATLDRHFAAVKPRHAERFALVP